MTDESRLEALEKRLVKIELELWDARVKIQMLEDRTEPTSMATTVQAHLIRQAQRQGRHGMHFPSAQ